MQPRDASVVADRIEDELRRRGNAERAEGARRYLKSTLLFVGADAATIRKSVRGVLTDAGPVEREPALALVDALWRRGIFDLRAAAVEILRARVGVLQADDLALVESFIRDSRTWALVDVLAVHVAGPLVVRFPDLGIRLDRWAGDADFWVRRAALLALLLPLRRGAGDFERFARYADDMLEEREFFVRKAIGWVLREVGKKRPTLVAAWLAPRTQRLSGVTVREAVRYLPAEPRAALLAAYRERRPAATVRGDWRD
jgi:3-methyladenine DNA glycosylase AlkD